jgi:hypothetical protein
MKRNREYGFDRAYFFKFPVFDLEDKIIGVFGISALTNPEI